MSALLNTIDLNGAEEWREYEWVDLDNRVRIYRINKPSKIYYKPMGSTQRVLDSDGIVHIVPAVGLLGCIIRFKGEVVA